MRRNFVAQVARFAGIGGSYLVAQDAHFGDQGVDLLLLAKYGAVEFFEQIFGVADLDLDLVDTVFQRRGFQGLLRLAGRCGMACLWRRMLRSS